MAISVSEEVGEARERPWSPSGNIPGMRSRTVTDSSGLAGGGGAAGGLSTFARVLRRGCWRIAAGEVGLGARTAGEASARGFRLRRGRGSGPAAAGPGTSVLAGGWFVDKEESEEQEAEKPKGGSRF